MLLKGKTPNKIPYRIHPNAHTSIAGLTQPFFNYPLKHSGGIYKTDPASSFVAVSLFTPATPKSIILTVFVSLLAIKTFSNFKSL